MVSRQAFAFFRAHAGGIVGRMAESALRLARAEAYANAHGWHVEWQWDAEGDLGDHAYWCPEARRRAAGMDTDGMPHSRQWRERNGCQHEVMLAILRDSDETEENGRGHAGTVLASLGSIIDADRAYLRVVAAELASEALAEIRARQRKQREARRFVARHFAL